MFRHSLTACLLMMVGTLSPAQAMEMGHHHHEASSETPATRAYRQAMTRMHQAHRPLSGNPDVDFVRQMIPHHQGAVEMAKIQLRYGRDERLKDFSRWVIRAQEQEIGILQQWIRRRDNGAVDKAAVDYYKKAMIRMHHAMMIKPTGDADTDFALQMIPHHQGAVDMAVIMLREGNDPELNRLAESIFTSQSSEIEWIKNWLSKDTENRRSIY